MTTPELSPDITFFHILPRLPEKSSWRFRRVSKQWDSFLTSSIFAKLQNLHHARPNRLLVLSKTKPYKFSTFNCETPKDGFTPSTPLPINLVKPHQYIRILSCVNGLVCLGINYHGLAFASRYLNLILWNPATGDHKTLSKPPLNLYQDCYETDKSSLYGLYYRSCDDDYKLLRITVRHNVYIYSLKSDSWRKEVGSEGFECARVTYWVTYFWEPNVWLDGSIYFLENVVGGTFSIVEFNTKSESLRVIATPPFGKQRKSYWNYIFVKNGCIHLWVNIKDSVNELWRMDGDGDWTKVLNSGEILCGPRPGHRAIHMMRSGDFLMYNERYCVYKLDIRKTHTEEYLRSYAPYGSRPWKYIETMVSPNQYMKYTQTTTTFIM